MRFSLWPVNFSTTITKLDMFGLGIPGAVKTKVKAMAELILEDSKTISPTVPVDTGDLESTGRIEKKPGGYAVVYGGVAESGRLVNYANQVHDDLNRAYKKPGSGAKFVEAHYLRRTEGAPAEILDTIKQLSLKIFGG